MRTRRRLLSALLALASGLALWWWAWPAWHVGRLVASESWPEASLSAREADRLHAVLLASPIAETGPPLLRRLAGPAPAAMCTGPRSWANSRVHDTERVYYVASDIWWEKLYGPEHAAARDASLPALLQSAQDSRQRALVLHALAASWTAAARPEVLRIAGDAHESIPTRAAAVNALLRHDDLDSFFPLALELIDLGAARGWTEDRGYRAPLPPTQRRVRLFEMLFRGAPVAKASPEARARVLRAGCQALQDLPEAELRAGYFLAGHLKQMAGDPPDFSPDQKAYTLGRTGGLSETFFTDTVKLALAWFAAHPEAAATERTSPPAL